MTTEARVIPLFFGGGAKISRAAAESAVQAGAASWLRSDASLIITGRSSALVDSDAHYGAHDAQLFSTHGVSLAACALARRAVLHTFASAAESAALLPLHLLSLLPLRAPLLVAATAVLSAGSVALEPMALGLVALDAAPPEPEKQPGRGASEAASAAADADLAGYIAASLGPHTESWSPLGLVLAQVRLAMGEKDVCDGPWEGTKTVIVFSPSTPSPVRTGCRPSRRGRHRC